jgi:2-polyprenyl-3-methyl-5-hydroxy-6-metoxy-1,4-benzoquinol methylase
MDYYKGKDFYTEGENQEDDIIKYIKKHTDGNFKEVLANDDRWTIFYHLSDIRKALLCWYDFDENAEVLEIGGGMGALTGLLCDKCAHVTTVELSKRRADGINLRYRDKENLDIYVGNINDINFGKKYDYITVIGVLEYQGNYTDSTNPYVDFLKKLSTLLKPDGKLLLAIENRFGLKYWCGAKEDHTGIPFDGINGYANGGKARTFGKKELENIISDAGFKNRKFYYPMPDYKLPQVIYSEKYLPKDRLQSRISPYYLGNETLLASEMNIYEDLIQNGVFEFFANSFLVECSFDDYFCDVNYAAITADRSEGNQLCTTIHDNKIVKKKALKKNGENQLKRSYDNILELQQKGISIVSHKIENDVLVMPYIENDTLEDELRIAARGKDREKFFYLLNKYWKSILNSSEEVDSEYNYFINFKEVDFGPILKKAYIDLLPHNCFFINDELVFFDQEFYKYNFPAKFILLRALKNLYAFDYWIESIISLDEVMEYFKLNDIWDTLDEEDCNIVESLKNHDVNKMYISWSSVNEDLFEKNAELLQLLFKPNRSIINNCLLSYNWLKNKIDKKEIIEYLKYKEYKRIAIYGYGDLGKMLYDEIENSTIEISYLIDQNADNICAPIPVINPIDICDLVDAVIVSVAYDFNSIKQIIEKKLDCPIISLEEIIRNP